MILARHQQAIMERTGDFEACQAEEYEMPHAQTLRQQNKPVIDI